MCLIEIGGGHRVFLDELLFHFDFQKYSALTFWVGFE